MLKSLIEKCTEYNKPLMFIFNDYKKSFDAVDLEKLIKALAESRVGLQIFYIVNCSPCSTNLCFKIDINIDGFCIQFQNMSIQK